MSEHSTVQVKTLMMLGVRSYTVDIATGWIVYRYEEGKMHIHNLYTGSKLRSITAAFNKEMLEKAILGNKTGKMSRASYMGKLARSGVRLYEVTLDGKAPSVTYITASDTFCEPIILE